MEWKTLAPRARTLFYLQAFTSLAVFWVPVSGAVGMGVSMFLSWWAGAILGSLLLAVQLILALWMPSLSWSRWAYAHREHDLLLARGVLFRSVTAIPYQRIQHVDVRQGPFEQSFGLAKVHIYTASGMGADGVIPGLALADAEALRDSLVVADGDDGV